MKKKLKKIPKFKNENEERDFWDKADTSKYFDYSKAKRVTFPNFKPSTETISLRLPAGLLHELKNLANRRDIPYQSFMKHLLYEKVQEEHSQIKAS